MSRRRRRGATWSSTACPGLGSSGRARSLAALGARPSRRPSGCVSGGASALAMPTEAPCGRGAGLREAGTRGSSCHWTLHMVVVAVGSGGTMAGLVGVLGGATGVRRGHRRGPGPGGRGATGRRAGRPVPPERPSVASRPGRRGVRRAVGGGPSRDGARRADRGDRARSCLHRPGGSGSDRRCPRGHGRPRSSHRAPAQRRAARTVRPSRRLRLVLRRGSHRSRSPVPKDGAGERTVGSQEWTHDGGSCAVEREGSDPWQTSAQGPPSRSWRVSRR